MEGYIPSPISLAFEPKAMPLVCVTAALGGAAAIVAFVIMPAAGFDLETTRSDAGTLGPSICREMVLVMRKGDIVKGDGAGMAAFEVRVSTGIRAGLKC